MPTDLSRRRVLAGAMALSACVGAVPARGAHRTSFTVDPFALGVASGWPTPTGISLWTRLAPDPWRPDGAMDPVPVLVRVEVAHDEDFRHVVHDSYVTAPPELAHSVHVDVDGLEPGRWYFYRFHAGDATSGVGRTRTADRPEDRVQRLRFAIGSCQHLEGGWYTAYRHLADEDLDLMVFLGDYIYENGGGFWEERRYTGYEIFTLDEYRVRHAETKVDPDLQRFHGLVPWLLTWDDHEVDNDWGADRSEDLEPDFLARRAAAFQAYFEHMPLPLRMTPRIDELRLYSQAVFGDLARFHVLDGRQYRSPHACPGERGSGSAVFEEGTCAELEDPSRSMLGTEQERWLEGSLAEGGQRWNVVAQPTLVTPIDIDVGKPGHQVWNDPWSGYPAARRRLLDALATSSNPVVVGGDLHGTYVAELRRESDGQSVASEFCGTSITTQGMPSAAHSDDMLAANPQLTYVNGHERGYLAFEITPERMVTRVRSVDTTSRDGAVTTAATFVVEDGLPTIVRS